MTTTPENIFKIEICGYESTQSFYLVGPEDCSQQRFKDLCAILFPQAAKVALEKAKQEDYSMYVGVREIVEQLMDLLSKFEFIPAKLKTITYPEEDIITREFCHSQEILNLLGHMREEVINYNEKIMTHDLEPLPKQ